MTLAPNDESVASASNDGPVADDLPDLTDRRRILLMYLLGTPVSATAADAVFNQPHIHKAPGTGQ